MKNPIEKRLQAETFKRLAETFLGKKNFSWWALLYASMIFIVAGWLPDGIAELLKKDWIGGGYKTIVSLAILFFIGFRLKKAIKYKGRIEVKSEQPSPAKAIAIFLSVLSMKKEIQGKEVDAINQALSQKTLNESALNRKTWEMPIIAIKHHMPALEFLYIFTSSGEDGSSKLIPVFTKVINSIFPVIKVKEFSEGGMDFENIEQVFEKVEEFYRKVKEEGLADEEVIIDITGGQKPNTIAGAIATLAFGRRFQYVSTIHKKVYSYDIGYFEG